MSYVHELPGYTSDSSGDTVFLWGKDQGLAPQGSFSPGRSFRIEEWWDCAAADLTRFLDVCGGITEPVTHGLWLRLVPLRNQSYPIALCVDASFKMYRLDAASGSLSRDRARVHLTFEAGRYPIDGANAFLTVDKATGRRFLPATGAAAAAGRFLEDPTKPESTQLLRVTLHRLAADIETTLGPYNGYANSDTWRGGSPGTWLFRGASLRPESIIGGFSTYEGQATFERSNVGWNNWINDAGNVVAATYNGGAPLAPTTSFTTLFGF
jgi:hypothetical protein